MASGPSHHESFSLRCVLFLYENYFLCPSSRLLPILHSLFLPLSLLFLLLFPWPLALRSGIFSQRDSRLKFSCSGRRAAPDPVEAGCRVSHGRRPWLSLTSVSSAMMCTRSPLLRFAWKWSSYHGSPAILAIVVCAAAAVLPFVSTPLSPSLVWPMPSLLLLLHRPRGGAVGFVVPPAAFGTMRAPLESSRRGGDCRKTSRSDKTEKTLNTSRSTTFLYTPRRDFLNPWDAFHSWMFRMYF